jgi:CRP-like cAMP-binding protein
MRRIELQLAEARQTSACRAVHPASARLARMLLECVLHTGELRLRLTQEFMGGMIGVGRTTVTRAASRLQDRGLIRYSRGRIIILDDAGLRLHACECYERLLELRSRLSRPA